MAGTRGKEDLQGTTEPWQVVEEQRVEGDNTSRILGIDLDNVPEEHLTTNKEPEATDPDFAGLVHEKYGYAVLGGVNPEGDPTSPDGRPEYPRVHPQRMFFPGETYDPVDLNPHAAGPRTKLDTKRIEWEQVRVPNFKRDCAITNPAFLEQFVNNHAWLKSRWQTRLSRSQQKLVSRTIKHARVMAILPYEARFDNREAARKKLKRFQIYQEQNKWQTKV